MRIKCLCFLTEFEFTIMVLNASKNREKAGSLYAIHHEFHQQDADKKTMPKEALEMKYMTTVHCILTNTPRSISL